MKRLVLAISITVGAAMAAPLYTATATLTGVNGATDALGNFTSPYFLVLSNNPSATLDVYCDDILDIDTIGETYAASVFSGSDLTGTYFAASFYPRIFWLVEQGVLGLASNVTTSEALWTLTDPSYAGDTAASNALLAASIGQTVNMANFLVIDGVSGRSRTQEMIAFDTKGINNPEPATLLLMGSALIGLSIFGRRNVRR